MPAIFPTGLARRSVSIDLIRIIAASSIFYFHVGIWTGWPGFKWGEYATSMFIGLAGFCALRYSATDFSQPLRQFWRRYVLGRFKAIYPTFALIALVLFICSFFYAPNKIGRHYSLLELGLNLLVVNQFVGVDYLTGPMWFVPFILQVYVFLPPLTKLGARWWMIAGAFLASGMCCALVFSLNPPQATHICLEWSPLFRLPEVAAGLILGRACRRADVFWLGILYAACAALAALLCLVWPPASVIALLPLRGAAVSLGIIVAARAVAAGLQPVAARPLLALMGRAAFPFFLLHAAGIHFVLQLAGRKPILWVAYFVACWIGSVAFLCSVDRASAGLRTLKCVLRADKAALRTSV
jgi:peptidoglycan/LPS O-acetylase OafA/YrhL